MLLEGRYTCEQEDDGQIVQCNLRSLQSRFFDKKGALLKAFSPTMESLAVETFVLSGKGLVKMSQVPLNRYAYYLTPQGFAEKSRLTAEYLSVSFNFFRRARNGRKPPPPSLPRYASGPRKGQMSTGQPRFSRQNVT